MNQRDNHPMGSANMNMHRQKQQQQQAGQRPPAYGAQGQQDPEFKERSEQESLQAQNTANSGHSEGHGAFSQQGGPVHGEHGGESASFAQHGVGQNVGQTASQEYGQQAQSAGESQASIQGDQAGRESGGQSGLVGSSASDSSDTYVTAQPGQSSADAGNTGLGGASSLERQDTSSAAADIESGRPNDRDAILDEGGSAGR